MSWILRKIADAGPWIDSVDTGEASLAVLRDLLPKEREVNVISVYEVQSPVTQVIKIAGAFAINRQKFESEMQAWVLAKKSSFLAAGLVLNNTKGDLGHKFADAHHRDLVLNSHSDLLKAATCFLSGELMPFPGKQLAAVTRLSLRKGEFDCAEIGRRGHSETSQAGKNLMKFIGEKIVTVRGVRA